jgi:transposase
VILPRSVGVFLATGRVDLRWSFDALSGFAKERMRQDPRSGALFVFLNARRTRAKVLFFEPGGYCILHRRLDRGTFPVPIVVPPGAEHVAISAAELELLLRGLEDPRKRVALKKRAARIMH